VLLTATSTAKPIRKPSRLVPQIRRPVDTSTTAATEDYAMPNCHSKTADGSGNAHVPRRCWLNAGEETMLGQYRERNSVSGAFFTLSGCLAITPHFPPA
jgi:hypothetical protein